MQTSIFQHWLKKLDEDMRKARRNILLLLDNCSSHVVDESILTNVKVHFFPPNTTSHLQPCDAGIIWSFKVLNYINQSKFFFNFTFNLTEIYFSVIIENYYAKTELKLMIYIRNLKLTNHHL